MMRCLAYLLLALAVLSANLVPHGMAQRPEVEFSNKATTEQFLQKIPLQYADAQSVEQTISKLFPHVSVASEQQTNTIYVRVDDKTLVELHEFAEAVETEAEAQQKKSEEEEESHQRELQAQAAIDVQIAEIAPLHVQALHVEAFELSEVQDEEFLVQMLTVAVEPYGGQFAWDADKRQLVGIYPEELHGMIKPLVSALSNPQALPSPVWQAYRADLLEMIRDTAIQLEELRSTLGPGHPKIRQLEQLIKSLHKWINADRAVPTDSLFDRSDRHANSLPINPDAQEFHQHEKIAAALAAELHEFRTAAFTPELDAKRTELKEQLNAAVNAAFSARQETQKAEAGTLRKQLERIEARIERRADIRERIVARRVAELLRQTAEDAWEPAPEFDRLPRRSIDADAGDLKTDTDTNGTAVWYQRVYVRLRHSVRCEVRVLVAA